MTTVYVVMLELEYEGKELEGIFSTEEKAKLWRADQRNPECLYVHPVVVDERISSEGKKA